MNKSIREAYGEALVYVGNEDSRVIVLDADVSSSTKTGKFGDAFPNRFFNMGIAEANMMGVCAGLAATGYIPFANTFAVFATSIALAAVRLYGSYSQLPMRVVGSYGGVSDAYDGPTHHALEDIAVMRALPSFEVYVACDEVQTRWLVKNAVEDLAPMYLRLSREAFPKIYEEGAVFERGRGRIIHPGTDVTIIACGLMVGKAMEAVGTLAREGISARVVDMFCIKPIDKELILQCARETEAIVTAEEHTLLGGLGSAVCEILCASSYRVPVSMVGITDTHTESGSYNALQRKYGLDSDAVAAAARKACGVAGR